MSPSSGCGYCGQRLGLASLADRLDIVGGCLLVDSAAGRGTTLRMDIPLRSTDG